VNDLEKYFSENTGRLAQKWGNYFEIYDRHFSRFRNTDVQIVEFGISHGGSLQMWKQYFGSKAKIYGVDINPHCKKLEEEQVEIFIGDQEDREFLKSLAAKVQRIDILIDDGGHTMEQQINTYEELFPFIDKNGVYLCEDIHTSYWPAYGGGYKRRNTFIEYSKNFIDYINGWHSEQAHKFGVSEFTKSVHSLHYYDSVLVIEKRPVGKPVLMTSGTLTIPEYHPPKKMDPWKRFKKRVESEMYRLKSRFPST
jgi:hypothetical protein